MRLPYITFFITQIHRVRFVPVNGVASRVKPSKKNFEKSWRKILRKKFRKSDVKFVISDLKNLGVLSSTKIGGFPKYYVRHFEFRKSDVKFVISDLKNLGVQSSTKIVGFPKYYDGHIRSAILNSENPISNS